MKIILSLLYVNQKYVIKISLTIIILFLGNQLVNAMNHFIVCPFLLLNWTVNITPSFSVQPWHQNMTACPTVNWPWCSQCSWTCWVWYPCCWGSSPHWRSKVETLGICWCTQGPCWCSFPWQAGSCGTAATLRVWPPERSWGAQLVELWTASHGPWAAGYGSPGLAAAQLRKRSTKIPTDWLTDCYKEGCPSPGSRPSCLRQRSATAVCGSLHKHASCDNKHLVHMTKKL